MTALPYLVGQITRESMQRMEQFKSKAPHNKSGMKDEVKQRDLLSPFLKTGLEKQDIVLLETSAA